MNYFHFHFYRPRVWKMAGEEEAMFITLRLMQVIFSISRMRRRRRFFNRLRLLSLRNQFINDVVAEELEAEGLDAPIAISLASEPGHVFAKLFWPSQAWPSLCTGVLEHPGWKRFVVGDGGQKDPEAGKISGPGRGVVVWSTGIGIT